jgi:hypothetical protein
MAVETPLTRITLGAASVADDLGYVALADLARALGGITEDYRMIGASRARCDWMTNTASPRSGGRNLIRPRPHPRALRAVIASQALSRCGGDPFRKVHAS